MSDGSGLSSRGSYASYDPDTRLWKTYQGCLFEEWETFSGTWPSSGTLRNGAVYPLRPWALLISGSGSSLLGTPTATMTIRSPEFRKGRAPTPAEAAMWPISEGHQAEFPTPSSTRYGTSGNGTGNNTISRGRPSLDTMARKGLWPTPIAGDAEGGARKPDGKRGAQLKDFAGPNPTRMWPTPRAQELGTDHAGMKDSLRVHVAKKGDTGQLNPTWVEWLMGFPSGWTDLELSATPSCPR
jgi:hypothetical protein